MKNEATERDKSACCPLFNAKQGSGLVYVCHGPDARRKYLTLYTATCWWQCRRCELPSNHFDILIAPRGRVIGSLRRSTLHQNELGFVIFDEAHELLRDTGCVSHARDIWNCTKNDSIARAIVSNEAIIDARRYLRSDNLTRITAFWTRAQYAVGWLDVSEHPGASRDFLIYHVIRRHREQGKAVVITPRIDDANSVQESLNQFLGDEVRTATLHSGNNVPERLGAAEAFNRGNLDVLVTCRIAFSGLRLHDFHTLIFWEPPRNWGLFSGAINKMGMVDSDTVVVLHDSQNERETACSNYPGQ